MAEKFRHVGISEYVGTAVELEGANLMASDTILFLKYCFALVVVGVFIAVKNKGFGDHTTSIPSRNHVRLHLQKYPSSCLSSLGQT